MSKSELLELIRQAYLAGILDTQNGCESWCNQGSAERSEELLDEFINSGDLTVELN